MEKEKTTSLFTSYQRLIIAVLALLQFTVILDFMIISPLGDILMKTLSVKTSEFGLVVSSYAFSAAISGILAAGFADHYDRKKLLIFFYTGFIAGTLFCGLATNFQTLLIARIVTGLFGGVIGSISLAIVADLFPPDMRGRVMGFIQMAFAGSQILGIPFGIFIAAHFGWHYTFFFIVILAALILMVVFLKMKPIDGHLGKQKDKSAFMHLWHTLLNKRYQTGFLATMFMAIGGFMIMPFSASFLVNNIRITQESLPVVFMSTGIASIVIMPLIGKLSDRVDKFKIFAFGSLLAATMVMIYVNLPVVPLWTVIMVNIILFTGIMSRMVPASSLNTNVPVPQDRGAYMSITSSLQQMSGGLGAVIAGMIVHQQTKTSPLEHFSTLGIIVATLVLCTIWFMYRVDRMVKSGKA
ncbi:MAG: MFS transporter [Bacteroidia bacterium]